MTEPVDPVPTNITAAEWLDKVAEVDFCLWQLGEMRDQVAKRSGLDIMIDQSTGYEDALRKEADEIVARIDQLRSELGL